jgi:hypothetical protein
VVSSVVGLATGVVTMWLIPPLEIAPGFREGTPLQIGGFIGAFAVTFLAGLALGTHWLEQRWARGL